MSFKYYICGPEKTNVKAAGSALLFSQRITPVTCLEEANMYGNLLMHINPNRAPVQAVASKTMIVRVDILTGYS